LFARERGEEAAEERERDGASHSQSSHGQINSLIDG